jgi:hypothetical protein
MAATPAPRRVRCDNVMVFCSPYVVRRATGIARFATIKAANSLLIRWSSAEPNGRAGETHHRPALGVPSARTKTPFETLKTRKKSRFALSRKNQTVSGQTRQNLPDPLENRSTTELSGFP